MLITFSLFAAAAVAPQLDSKTVQEVIEFYYVWKKTSHYKEWKRTYTPDERDHKSNYEFGDEI